MPGSICFIPNRMLFIIDNEDAAGYSPHLNPWSAPAVMPHNGYFPRQVDPRYGLSLCRVLPDVGLPILTAYLPGSALTLQDQPATLACIYPLLAAQGA